MIDYIERLLLEEWLDTKDLSMMFLESWEDSYNEWLQSYYNTNLTDKLLDSYISIFKWKSSYEKESKKFNVTWAWLKYMFKKEWLNIHSKKTKWMITWACKMCWTSLLYYKSKNRKFCSLPCRIQYNRWENE